MAEIKLPALFLEIELRNRCHTARFECCCYKITIASAAAVFSFLLEISENLLDLAAQILVGAKRWVGETFTCFV